MGENRIIERKLRSTKVRLFTTLLFYNSVFLGRYEKNVFEFTPTVTFFVLL